MLFRLTTKLHDVHRQTVWKVFVVVVVFVVCWSKQWNNENLLTLKAVTQSNVLYVIALFNCRNMLRDSVGESEYINKIYKSGVTQLLNRHLLWPPPPSSPLRPYTKPIVRLSSIIIIFSAFTQSTKLIVLMTIFCFCRRRCCCFYCCRCRCFFWSVAFVSLSFEIGLWMIF